MTFEEKTKEYRDQITSLKEIDSLEVYQWLISLGKKLNENPLSKEKQTQENKVVRCQYDLYVDKEDDTFKVTIHGKHDINELDAMTEDVKPQRIFP